jgi:hypothetical protein
MATFNDLKFHSDGFMSRASVDFANGYGASVIIGRGSYGGEDGLYELAVMKDGSLCYDTPITDDVVGRLSEQDVTELLARIEALPAA